MEGSRSKTDTAARRSEAEHYGRLVADLTWRTRFFDASAVETLRAELPKITRGLEFAFETNNVALASDYLGGLWSYWIMHGDLREGARWADRYLALETAKAPPSAQLTGLLAASEVLRAAGDFSRAADLKRQFIALAQEAPEAVVLGKEASRYLPSVHTDLSQVELELDRIDDALALAKAGVELRREAYQLGLGPRYGINHALFGLGKVLLVTGDYTRARDAFVEAAEISGEAPTVVEHAENLAAVAETLALLGEGEAAAHTLQNALIILREHADRSVLPGAIRVAGLLAIAQGTVDHGVSICAAADRAMTETGAQWDCASRSLLEAGLAHARATINGDAYEDAHRRGRRWSDDEALAQAVSVVASRDDEDRGPTARLATP